MSKYLSISLDSVPNVKDWRPVDVRVQEGVRKKMALEHPNTSDFYLFKVPKPGREHQIWSELIASYIAGDLLGWSVQHAGVARDGSEYGNLLRFIYEADEQIARLDSIEQSATDTDESKIDLSRNESLVEGYQACLEVDRHYDKAKGRRHTLDLIFRVCDHLVDTKELSADEFKCYWARAIALDSLISNTDRHAENWAYIQGDCGIRMAKLFDNGSSMGCALEATALRKAFDDSGQVRKTHIDRQRANGRHHLRICTPDKKGTRFEELIPEFLKRFPDGRDCFEQALNLDVSKVDELMTHIREDMCIPAPYALCEKRQKHISAMLEMGRNRILDAIGK